MISVSTILRNLAAATLMLGSVTLPAGAHEGAHDGDAHGDAPLGEAIRLYDAGRYAEALPLLEQVVAAGNIDGITRYRLYFCQRSVGDPAQRETLEAARDLLEQQVKIARGFEAAFYLSSSYTNLGQADQVPRIAAEITSRFESGEVPAPEIAVERFRLGKLYADQGRDLDARPWLTRAVEGFAAASQATHLPYFEWSARWLAQRAMSDERFEAAAGNFAQLKTMGRASLQDLDGLGLSSLMIGDYKQAGDAWRTAARMNPAEADPYRYGAGLAQLADKAGELPISPDGERSWEEVGREELETLLREQSQKVREIRAEIEAAGQLTPERRAEFAARLIEPRPLFTAAALEYKRRGLSLREAAFFGGYAPLIFKAREWQVPHASRRMTPQEAAAQRQRKLEELAARGEEPASARAAREAAEAVEDGEKADEGRRKKKKKKDKDR